MTRSANVQYVANVQMATALDTEASASFRFSSYSSRQTMYVASSCRASVPLEPAAGMALEAGTPYLHQVVIARFSLPSLHYTSIFMEPKT